MEKDYITTIEASLKRLQPTDTASPMQLSEETSSDQTQLIPQSKQQISEITT